MADPPVLRLGVCDSGAKPPDVAAFWRARHEESMPARWRGEKDGEWTEFRELPGKPVLTVQTALRGIGFYPQGELNGIFDYRTLSAARLFQEYVRNAGGAAEIGAPDGVVGPRTHARLATWATAKRRPDWASAAAPSPECRYWLRVLRLYRELNAQRPVHRVIGLVNASTVRSDSLKVGDWRAEAADLNLIGIRRKEWVQSRVRANDDLFVLLVNGSVFKFYGSTDPSPKMADRPDEAFITRGQHEYRFGWHNIGADKLPRSYRAFKPARYGVLACRDVSNDDALTDDDLRGGLAANPTVNIHWSGVGTANWSAACQVIAGARYVDHRGTVIDCRDYAATSYVDLGTKTRGAYNVLLDLLTVHAPSPLVRGGTRLRYTLINEGDLRATVDGGQPLAAAALADSGLGAAVAIEALVERLVRV